MNSKQIRKGFITVPNGGTREGIDQPGDGSTPEEDKNNGSDVAFDIGSPDEVHAPPKLFSVVVDWVSYQGVSFLLFILLLFFGLSGGFDG